MTKIDRVKLKKSSSEVPPDCRSLIERLKGCNEAELLKELKSIKNWNYGKCELYHWIDVLDLFDGILEKGVHKEREVQWALPCDHSSNEMLKELIIHIVVFTALLIEHSFSRHLYNSMEHLTTLLSSSDMQIVLAVLNLLYVFSKRSNFISRLNSDRRQALIQRLNYLAESWGGKENGFGLAECCQDLSISSYPSSATTLHFEFYCDEAGNPSSSPDASSSGGPGGLASVAAPPVTPKSKSVTNLSTIHIDSVDQSQLRDKSLADVMEELVENFSVPKNKQILLFTHLRLANSFSNYRRRLQCVQARLQALSIIVYCNSMSVQDNTSNILYNGFIEELVDVLELKNKKLLEIKAAALRTLTSVIHLDHSSKLSSIIDVTGAASYHGFLPTLVRSCIQALIDGNQETFPLPFATALFSFLYHLASYENGGESLVSCGMIESLLKVINWKGTDPEHITFVTRAVRVIDLITNLDMSAFQAHSGLNIFINRLETEVDVCRREQPFEIEVPGKTDRNSDMMPTELPASPSPGSVGSVSNDGSLPTPMDVDAEASPKPSSSTSGTTAIGTSALTTLQQPLSNEIQCYAQRAALLKSMLNFLKKAIQDSAFSDSIRHVMDGSLPKSLRHVISNAEYYGPSLFMLATDVVTVYVFQEPSLLSSLQESGLTNVVLHALLIKEVPATREVLASLPNVFSALCLNTRGLESFVACKPFQRIFKVLLSADYLPAMRRRRSSDPMGDTASNLGNAMDELMRHQPSLRADATTAIINLLQELCSMGSNPNYICAKPSSKGIEGNNQPAEGNRPSLPVAVNDGGSSDEEDEDDEDTATGAAVGGIVVKINPESASTSSGQIDAKQPVPLVDYILNVMRFVDAILSNNSTDDHCREFVKQKGLDPLLKLLQLPNLPIDFPLSPACLSVASVCKSILTLAHEREVLKEGLRHLTDVLVRLDPLHESLCAPGGSVLLEELVDATTKANLSGNIDPLQSATLTPLLHAMSAAHAYIILFVHVCRTGQSDMRTLSVTHWGSDLGISVLKKLSRLYTSLVWESTVLLALCSESTSNATWQFGRHQLEKLANISKDQNAEIPTGQDNEQSIAVMEVDEPAGIEQPEGGEGSNSKKKELKPGQHKLQAQVKQIKPLLSSASRLGRALAELFGLLVKLCVGSPIRHRRSHHAMPNIPISPSPAARAVAVSLTELLANGLSWTPPETSPIPKFRLTFYICSVGFTSPMLFDERKYPFHLMLQKFVTCGGQDEFFKTFQWALSQGGKVPLEEGLEHPDLPDGTGEFLDSWLMLLEKMVNPKTVLESPHVLPSKGSGANYQPFDPVKYLISTQKKAFECVMHLWNKKPLKTYGERMSESVLTILCHLLKGETIIQEKLTKAKDQPEIAAPVVPGGAAPGTVAGTRPANRRNELEEQGINADQLQQLQDMGFARELALEALLQTTTLEQATEYLLSHPGPLRTPAQGPDWDMSEEDQMSRAIAMSLGENVTEEDKVEDAKDDEPLTQSMMDGFTKNILPGCLQLLDTLPETVYRVCDLLIAISARNGEKWTEDMLRELIGEITDNVGQLMKTTEPMTIGDKKSVVEWASQVSQIPEAAKAATRIHVFSLLFEEKRNECATLVHETDLLHNLIQLLEATQNTLAVVANSTPAGPVATPKWLAPVILLVDLFDKAAIASSRKAPLLGLIRRQWKWFDDRSGKWTAYTGSNNKTIDDSYKNGESFVRFAAGRRKYTVQFSTMVQINEETGNWRPIMFVNDDKAMEVTEESGPSKQTPTYKIVQGLQQSHCTSLVRACVGFISIPVEPDTLHAVMRLCLRLTRNYENASLFAELGGMKAILQLTQASAFTGFNSLATLIVRHILEEPLTLRQTMEKVIRSTTHHSPLSCKEMHYILRVLGPAACRDSLLFTEVGKNILRISLVPLTKREDEDSRLLSPNSVQMLKLLPAKQSNAATAMASNVIKSVICDLLKALTVKTRALRPDEARESQTVASLLDEPLRVTATNLLQRGLEIAAEQNEEDSEAEPKPSSENKSTSTGSLSSSAKDDEGKKNRLLMIQSSILRLLAELARSYSVVAKLITDYSYQPGQSELVTEECSALSFILDQLLPGTQSVGDKDCPALARVLVASLASCNHCPDAQTALVSEVKSSLLRALSLVESNEKHAKIQSITGIMCVMIESCPSISQSGSQSLPNSVRNPPQGGLNNIVKIMLRKNLVNDLARVTHSLDLSSPHMAMTVNSALKPLETLSRIVNLPSCPVASHPKKAKIGATGALTTHEAMEEDNAVAVNATLSELSIPNSIRESGNDRNRLAALESNLRAMADDVMRADIQASRISDANPFDDSAVDDNTDNEGAAVEDGVPFDIYSERNPVSDGLLEEATSLLEMRHDTMGDDSQNVDETHANESHDNVMNSHNGAESESGEDSDSEDDDDEDNSGGEDDRDDEDDDDDDEHVDDDDDVEDDEGGSGYVDHDELDDSVMRYQDRESDPFVFDIEEMLPASMFQEGGFRLSSLLPMLDSEPQSSVQDTQPSVPPAPGNVAISHPLLVRHGDLGTSMNLPSSTTAASILQVSRNHRSGRGQRMYRPVSGAGLGHHSWHLPISNRHPAPAGASSATPTQVIFASNDFQIIAAEDDLFELQDTGLVGSGGSSTLGAIPSAMLRWTEESRVLDGDSMHDCVASIKSEIIEVWEKHRDEEISERKEKRKKLIEEDERQKKESREKKLEASARSAAATTTETKVENESSVNANTERLAESLAEQVLGTAMASSAAGASNGTLTRTEQASSMDLIETPFVVTGAQADIAQQSDNEITEMICSEATTEQERPVDLMETNGDSSEAVLLPTPDTGDVPSSAPALLAVLTPEDLSINPGSDGSISTNTASNVDVSSTGAVIIRDDSTPAPEASNTVEVAANTDNNANSDAQSSSQAEAVPDIPEGVDPSFLAALPENIRQEVIAEQLRLQRIQQQRSAPAAAVAPVAGTAAASSGMTTTFSEVNPEFLAALPPSIQEEVLAQQRAEQQRIASQTANPEAPVDPANFISTLPPSLRRQVLADMDDSLLALLPEGLASEAQTLRQELEARHRQIQERFFSSHPGSALSRILRTAAGRVGGTRYTIHTVQGTNWPWNIGPRATNSSNLNSTNSTYRSPLPGTRFKGRQMLDHEALSCLLILLFVDEPKLNISRLHRVLRNLSHHVPTRQWVIQSLLTIMERTRENKEAEVSKSKKGTTSSKVPSGTVASWLSISLDAALGCRTNVFQVHRTSGSGKKVTSNQPLPPITIHPQAAPLVSRHVLDALISLAKAFPQQFLADINEQNNAETPTTKNPSSQGNAKDEACPAAKLNKDADFWDVLVKLDSLSTTKKGKSAFKSSTSSMSSNLNSSDVDISGSDSTVSHIATVVNLLSHPVIKRSSLLTDRLLRLLSLIALALPSHEPATPTAVGGVPLRAPSNLQAFMPPAPQAAITESADTTSILDSDVLKLEDSFKLAIEEEQLKLAVDVLTSKSCSEEGLEDVTSFLLRLSRSCARTRQIVVKLLLKGSCHLGTTVCENIASLNSELKSLNLKSESDEPDSKEADKVAKGMLHDRFTMQAVVINAPTNIKASVSKEVQLPSMAALTSKTSSQSFFLRILKVIIQLKETMKQQKSRSNSTVSAASSQNVRTPAASSAASTEASSAASTEASGSSSQETQQIPQSMEVDESAKVDEANQESLSAELNLDHLWNTLSECLLELADAPDHHAVLVLQPAVEAFFLVHASEREPQRSREASRQESRESQLAHVNFDIAPASPLQSDQGGEGSSQVGLPVDTQKFLQFAETHKVVLNQILRQSTTPLADGPFSVLVDHTRVLDFDVKRRYFRQELERLDDGSRREDLAVHVRREHVFEDSFRELYRRSYEEWKNRFYIVFEGEEGQDAGGLLREWYTIISREIFNPMYALFTISPGDRVTYMINSASHCNSNHLQYFKFVGRVIAKAVYDNKLLECYFTRSFYKHILGKSVKYTDMESEDYSFYQGLVFLLEHTVKELGYELTFSVEVQEFGVTEVRDLKPNGRNIPVREEEKQEYVRRVCQEKMTGAIRKQLNAFLEGFYEIIPKRLISIFNEQEMELLISGLPNIDIDDLKANTEYHKYQVNSLQIQWFWRALRNCDQADRAKFLQFVTGTSKVPLQGFASLEGMNGTQKFQIHRDDRSTDRLPSAHTCFNQLDLPAYETYDKLRTQLLKAIRECSEGFGFA